MIKSNKYGPSSPHRRSVPTTSVSVGELEVDTDFRHDVNFQSLYKNLLLGKIQCAYTRLPIDQITSGFYQHSDKGIELVSNFRRLPTGAQKALLANIRRGNRPQILVYWNSMTPGNCKYVCPDDEHTLAAYRELNISMVPCTILRPTKQKLDEASIWMKQSGNIVTFSRAVSPLEVPAEKLDLDFSSNFEVYVDFLIEKCGKLRTVIKQFHIGVSEDIHYHQMLYAFLLRHERGLETISLLASSGRVEHASVITRMSYEAFLNFYVDWISPTFIGPRIQLLSAVRYKGQSQSRSLSELQVIGKLERLLEVTSEKARISPLGTPFHKMIYPPLSLASHQSYVALAFESKDFSDDAPRGSYQDQRQLLLWLNMITAALLRRVGSDVGYV